MSRDNAQPTEIPTVTSISLLDQVRCHDREGWGRFVALYCPLIYDACRRSGVKQADADDVTQEVLQSVALAINGFRKERPSDSFRGWLYRIVQNKVRDHFRRSAKQPPGVGGVEDELQLDQIPEFSDGSISSTVNGDPVLMRALEMIRAEFQEQTWTAFWRLTVEGHTAAEIATDLGMKANAVRQAKFRVMQRLRSEFGELIELPE